MQISGHTTGITYKRHDIALERGAITGGDTMEDFFSTLGTTGYNEKVGHKLGTSKKQSTFSGVV